MTGTNRRQFIKLTGAGIGVTGLAGCLGDNGNGGSDEYPPNAITFVNAYSEGGGVDTNFRQLQEYFEGHLGTNLSPDYRSGAGTRTAVTTVVQDQEVLRIGGTLSPATPAAVAVDETEGTEPQFTLDDIQPLGTLSGEAAVIRVREDEDRFRTIQELVEYSVDNSITVGASGPTNRNVLSVIQLLEATEADFTIVPYDGGGPTETALLQGEIDVAARSLYNSAGIADDSHCLCIYAEENPEPDLTNDAPPINDELGTDIDYAPSDGTQFYYVSAAAAEAYPDRYEFVQEAFENTHNDEDYRADLEAIGEDGKLVWNSPDETDEILQSAYQTYLDFAPLFDQYVQS